jgi:Holliday junction resolvase RusA-like endonuclease
MKITIPFKGFSVNSQYYADRRFGMTAAFKQWAYQVNHVLEQYNSEFLDIRNNFDECKHGLSVSMTFFYKDYYSKNGKISRKVFDVTNLEKSLLDICVDAAHYGAAPYKSPNLKLNDSNVIELLSKKLPADRDYIEVEIFIIPLPFKS